MFAIAWRGKQAIDNFGVGIWRGVGEESRLLGGGWRQSDKVEGNATQQGELVGWSARLKFGGFELLGDEVVDGIACPLVQFMELGQLGTDQGAEGPYAERKWVGGAAVGRSAEQPSKNENKDPKS